MKDTFLLKSENAVRLYETYAKDLPIIDFHNHLSVADIVSNRMYDNITQLWLASDPYKHRLMRICGVEEHYITGNATDREKFQKFCGVYPYLAGNPVYDWGRMELAKVFGIHELPNKDNADVLYDKIGEMLQSREFSNNGILGKFRIDYQSPVAALMDDLSDFQGDTMAPSLRGDNLLAPNGELKAQLKTATGVEVTDTDSYIRAVCVLLDKFNAAGCRFADHALDSGFFETDTDGSKTEILTRLGVEYAKRGWTLLLHMGAKRQTSDRLLKIAGPAGGFAAVGGNFPVAKVADLLGAMERTGGLPDTVLFPLDMSEQAALAVMQGSFSQDGIASKVQLGPAWWWCDHTLGIKNTLSCIASFGAFSQFIGMTTDSRSILSLVRHDYFRRLLCSWIDEQNTQGEWELPFETMGDIVRKISYENANDKIQK